MSFPHKMYFYRIPKAEKMTRWQTMLDMLYQDHETPPRLLIQEHVKSMIEPFIDHKDLTPAQTAARIIDVTMRYYGKWGVKKVLQQLDHRSRGDIIKSIQLHLTYLNMYKD